MNTVTLLAEVIGAVFVLVGLSVLNKKSFEGIMKDLQHSKGLLWLTGIVTFLAGAISIALASQTAGFATLAAAPPSSGWYVVIPIIGWLMVIKGAFITLYPSSAMSFYRKFASGSLIMTSGVVAVVMGIILFALGFTAY